jgi:hypothetical protein
MQDLGVKITDLHSIYSNILIIKVFINFLFAVQELEREIARLEGELGRMKLRPSKMSVQDIIGDNDKVFVCILVKCTQ